jgi:predicted acetyltransferase
MQNERTDLIKTIRAIADYAMDRAHIATMEQNKYAVATWHHVASTLLDLVEQAESWDEDSIRLIKSHRDRMS